VEIDPELRRMIDAVTAVRPRRVLDHILERGFITTAELANEYGYNHPPRAARDVREHGIPLETFRVTGPDGRSIGAYRLGDAADATPGKSGRRAFPKRFKDELVAEQGEQCALCGWKFPSRALQIDHRVPYEVAGDAAPLTDLDGYMLVCGSCNRSKSWSCEHCPNWLRDKDPGVCRTCLWASPAEYAHVATEQRRSVTVTWQGDEISDFESLLYAARRAGISLPDYARQVLQRSLR
jgi:hypothetical protein